MTVFDEFLPETVVIETEHAGRVQKQSLTAPKMLLMQDFASGIQKAAGDSEPVAVKMSRWINIYDNFNQKWITREAFVRFTNNAYESKTPN